MSLEGVITKYGGQEVSPMTYYSQIFHFGEHMIQSNETDTTKLGNPIIVGSEDGKLHRFILFEDSFDKTLTAFSNYDWAIISGLSYWGRRNNAASQARCFAIIIDLDFLDDEHLNNFFYAAFSPSHFYPIPQFVNLSGGGVHLVYQLEEPLDMYPNTKTQLKQLKYALTRLVWNRYTTPKWAKSDIQIQGINQGFRIVGGKIKPKYGDGVVRSFMVNKHPIAAEDLNDYVPSGDRVDLSQLYSDSKLTLDEAKIKYPDWYEKRIVQGEPVKGWTCKPDLFWWWYRKIKEEATFGHRYFCIMTLAIYGVKCGMTRNQVLRAARALKPRFNEIKANHPFTKADIKSAMECFDERYRTFPRDDIAKLTGIDIPVNKRNGQKQADHLEETRAIRDIRQKRKGTNWWDNGGRPKGSGAKQKQVLEWKAEHPTGNKSQCARQTGLSRTTVIKWWDAKIENEVTQANMVKNHIDNSKCTEGEIKCLNLRVISPS